MKAGTRKRLHAGLGTCVTRKKSGKEEENDAKEIADTQALT